MDILQNMSDNNEYYTTGDIAKELGISMSKARALLVNEPDVLNFGVGKKALRRVPREVFLRILKRSANPVRPAPMRKAG